MNGGKDHGESDRIELGESNKHASKGEKRKEQIAKRKKKRS
jgi:hypothetical protein